MHQVVVTGSNSLSISRKIRTDLGNIEKDVGNLEDFVDILFNSIPPIQNLFIVRRFKTHFVLVTSNFKSLSSTFVTNDCNIRQFDLVSSRRIILLLFQQAGQCVDSFKEN